MYYDSGGNGRNAGWEPYTGKLVMLELEAAFYANYQQNKLYKSKMNTSVFDHWILLQSTLVTFGVCSFLLAISVWYYTTQAWHLHGFAICNPPQW